MTSRDPIEFLREAARLEKSALPPGPAPAEVIQRLHQAESTVDHPSRPRRHRRRVLAVGIAGLLAAGGGGVAWAVAHRQRAVDVRTIICHQFASVDSSQFNLVADGSDPVQLCTAGWPTNFPEWGPPPPMVACVSVSGLASVFPGSAGAQTCASLGLTPLDNTLGAADRALLSFQDEVSVAALQLKCAPPEEIATLARQYLSKFALSDWTVVIEGRYGADEPCGSLLIDPVAKTVKVEPLPDIFGS